MRKECDGNPEIGHESHVKGWNYGFPSG